MHWTILELYAQTRVLEMRLDAPKLPKRSGTPAGWRRPLARTLIGLGLRLDADASPGAAGSRGAAPIAPSRNA